MRCRWVTLGHVGSRWVNSHVHRPACKAARVIRTRQRATSCSNTSVAKPTVHTQLKEKINPRRVPRKIKTATSKFARAAEAITREGERLAAKLGVLSVSAVMVATNSAQFAVKIRRAVRGTTSLEQKLLPLVKRPRIHIMLRCTAPMRRVWGV